MAVPGFRCGIAGLAMGNRGARYRHLACDDGCCQAPGELALRCGVGIAGDRLGVVSRCPESLFLAGDVPRVDWVALLSALCTHVALALVVLCWDCNGRGDSRQTEY